jgi:hypothetical protein
MTHPQLPQPSEPVPAARLDPNTMSRLGFILVLYQQAMDQGQLPEPLNAQAVLTMHDVVELFLTVAADHLNAPVTRNTNFMDYWRLLDPANLPGGVVLGNRHGMDRLNALRVALKHHGTMPATAAVNLARADVRSFLEDSTSAVFGIPFASIDMAEVIPQHAVREMVRSSSAAAVSGDLQDAMGLLAEAYDELRSSLGARSLASFGRPFDRSLPKLEIYKILHHPQGRRGRPRVDEMPLADQLFEVTEAAKQMQQGMYAMAFGIDYRQLVRFELLTPGITVHVDDHRERHVMQGYAPTQEEFDYCRQFVVTVALRLSELDVHATLPAWWT